MSIKVVNRNNVAAGSFVVGSVLLAVAISFVLSDVADKFGSKKMYVFRYTTDVGVTGLKPGANITFGGLSVGKVKSISAHHVVDTETGVEVIDAHDVHVALMSDLVLYEDAFADLTLPMLGGVSTINIPAAGFGAFDGGPSDANTVLDEGEILRGRFAPSILTQLGFSTEDAEKIKRTIRNVEETSANANDSSAGIARMVEALEPEFLGGVDDGRSTIANIREFTEGINGEAGWSGKVDDILTKADDAALKLDPVLVDARSAINEAREVIADGKPRVAKILENVEQTTQRVNDTSMVKLDELLEKGSITLGSYKEIAEKTSNLIDINKPKVNAVLDSARSIGVHGELFLEEIRSQPWRLLKKPTQEDLEREPIYEAARAYADAVSDLRIASEALDAAVIRMTESGSTGDAAALARISKVIEAAYGRYEAAEIELLERLRSPRP
ncbi:MAG: hypothetical protein JKX70_09535 [Phycisphaerales bacterium]|nr:hypothetical protein [Phycisphaerales bacterium]